MKIKFSKNKKANHVEITISFLIFVLFLTFLFIFTQFPVKSETEKDLSLELLKTELIHQLSSNVTVYYIKNSSIKNSENCIRINELGLNSNLYHVVKDVNGNSLNSKRESGELYISWSSNQNFFKTYYSNKNFSNNNLTGILNCQVGEIKSIQSQNKILEINVLEALQTYSSNYSYLKSSVGVSESDDFNFQFVYENKTIIGESVSDIKANIIAKEVQVDYLDINGNEKNGGLIFYLW